MSILALDIVTTAAILFAVASGLMIILGVMKLINFAHGAFLTVGGYTAYLTTEAGISPWLSAPLALVFGFVCGLLIERVVVRPLYDRPLDAILGHLGAGYRHRPADHAGIWARRAVRREPDCAGQLPSPGWNTLPTGSR